MPIAPSLPPRFASRSASEYPKSGKSRPPVGRVKGEMRLSNVYRRKRSESEMEFYNTAIELRKQITKLCMREKVFPKRYRFVYSIPIIELARDMTQNTTFANSIYPTNQSEAELRRTYQIQAIGCCEALLQEFQYAYEVLPIPENTARKITAMLLRESKMLRGWKKKDVSRYMFDE